MRVFFITALFALCVPHISSAQNYKPADPIMNKVQPQAHYANPVFDTAARRALRGPTTTFSFTEFRRLYAQTRQYAPIPDEIIDQLLTHAFEVQSAQSADQLEEALENYNNLLLDHLANVKVVMQALSLSKRDKRLGNAKTLDWIRSGLILNLMQSGDGLTLKTAYDVITMDEEIILFKKLGLRNISSDAQREGIIYYNMHAVRDLRRKKDMTLFVNTSFPMAFLERLAEERKGLTFDIRRQ